MTSTVQFTSYTANEREALEALAVLDERIEQLRLFINRALDELEPPRRAR